MRGWGKAVCACKSLFPLFSCSFLLIPLPYIVLSPSPSPFPPLLSPPLPSSLSPFSPPFPFPSIGHCQPPRSEDSPIMGIKGASSPSLLSSSSFFLILFFFFPSSPPIPISYQVVSFLYTPPSSYIITRDYSLPFSFPATFPIAVPPLQFPLVLSCPRYPFVYSYFFFV